ncbi:hypothetical protein FB451DRAFT_1218231 [Mycena latifolia]|nr:hypothetical protein FB451DRAFT_1218231 [Mycena latifolia]
MTSRVQKGGLIFKPVAKARARATSTAPRQSSTPAEGHGSTAPSADASTAAAALSIPPPSMPPPASIPLRSLDPDVSRFADVSQAAAPLPRAVPVVVASSSRIAAPPVIATSSQISLNAPSQPRNSPAPPAIISHTTPVPTITAPSPFFPAPSPTLVNPPADAPFLHNFQVPPPDFHFPEDLSQLIAPSNPSTLALTSEGTQKKKLRKRKKTDPSNGDVTEGEKPKKAKRQRVKRDVGQISDGAVTDDEKPKKGKRKRVKKDAEETSDGAQPKPKRKRKAAKTADDADEASTPPRKRRKKSTQPAFDPDAEPGEEIDPTVVTMAELCADNGQGRISSKAVEIQKNHLAWKQQSKEKRARMKALAEQKKYGKADEEDGNDGNAAGAATLAEAAAPTDSAETIVGPSKPSEPEPTLADVSGSGFDYSQDLTASRFTVQVRIGPNGETIIDEESLTVDRTEEADTTNYVHVVESDNTKFVNSASYTKKCRGSRWSAEETDLFFEALAQHGENYELISLVLPGRSRTACKNKFKAEDKKDSARITRCLESRTPIDMKTLGRLTGRDFSGPVPVIRVPTPPPVPESAPQAEQEPETPLVRKRSRSRTLPSTEGVQIIGDADSYDA